jgi:Protein phosphatase 2C
MCDTTQMTRWRVAQASVIGTSHQVSGLPCQDSSGHRIINVADHTYLIAAVSDGAGSASYSDQGSRYACETVIALIDSFIREGATLDQLTRTVAVNWILQVAEGIKQIAEECGRAGREYDCTLLVAVVASEQAVFFQVGDGAIVTTDQSGEGWMWVFWPQHGEFLNSTNFVVSSDVRRVLEFEFEKYPIPEVALLTDGLENLVLQYGERMVHEPFFNSMIPSVRNSLANGRDDRLCEGLERYLLGPKICERTDDDKTLLLASRWNKAESTK